MSQSSIGVKIPTLIATHQKMAKVFFSKIVSVYHESIETLGRLVTSETICFLVLWDPSWKQNNYVQNVFKRPNLLINLYQNQNLVAARAPLSPPGKHFQSLAVWVPGAEFRHRLVFVFGFGPENALISSRPKRFSFHAALPRHSTAPFFHSFLRTHSRRHRCPSTAIQVWI